MTYLFDRSSLIDTCITYFLACFDIDVDDSDESNQYDPDTNILEQHMERDHLE